MQLFWLIFTTVANTIKHSMPFISIRRFFAFAFITFSFLIGLALAQPTKSHVIDLPLVESGIPNLVRAGAAKSNAPATETITHADSANAVIRSRPVTLDFSVLQHLRTVITNDQPQTIRIAFFDDAVLLVQINRTERFSGNGMAYIGIVPGIAFSQVVIVEENGVVSGNVNALSVRYQIRNVGEAGHVMQQIDANMSPPDHSVLPVSAALGADAKRERTFAAPVKASKILTPPEAAINTAADDGSLVDVMVVFTQAARISQGSTAAMKSLINLGIAEANNAYANSGVVQRVRLVYAGEVNYTEVDLLTDRDNLTGTTDGAMDEVHALRNLYGADIVSLWGNYPLASGCGQSNLMTTEAASFESQAFHVVNRTCDINNYSFAHELGHNMGLQHDLFDGNGGTTVTPAGSATPTAINYAHGYVDMPNRFRSVMAISAQCSAQMPAIDCLRIPYFSNLDINVDNRPFFPAAAASAPTGNANAQEAKTLNDTRETTANFRMSVNLTGPGTVIFSPAIYSVNEAAGSVTLSATRHAGINGAVTVNVSTVNGTATAGTDFTTTSTVIAWANGEAGSKTITIPILQDGLLDGPKAFSVTMDTPTGGVAIGAPSGISTSADINIIDADTDSFPVGCTLPLTGWSNPPAGATSGWAIATDSFFGPSCSLKSAPTTNGNKAQIQFTGDFTTGTIKFARRVSSQSGDCLRFFIDGVAQDIGGTCATGEVAWSMVNVAMPTSGTHTIIWSYEKDSAGSAGADAAWIDSVVLPLAGAPTIQSAPPAGGFLNIPYSHTFVSSGSPTITYALAGTLPDGLMLNQSTGVISGTPITLGTFPAIIRATNGTLPLGQQSISISIIGIGPGVPVIGAATPGNGQASIAFQPPVSQGSTPITGYTVSCNPNAFTATGTVSPINVTGLINGTEYTCAVAATNIYGTSASSASVLVMPAPIRPGAPTIGAATPGNMQAFIAFTPPASDGGSPITAYTSTCNPGALTGTAAHSPVNVSNLVNGTLYSCSVVATNAVGTSVASATIAVTPALSPPLSLVGAVSRKTHMATGTFDVVIDTAQAISGAISVEPRAIGSGHTIVLQFNNVINSIGAVSVVDGANASIGASAVISGNEIIVTIPALADNTRITISIDDINGATSPRLPSLGFLVGDANNTRSVNSSDISGVKARSGQTTNAANFRFDVNASGAVNSSDISVVKARSGLVLP